MWGTYRHQALPPTGHRGTTDGRKLGDTNIRNLPIRKLEISFNIRQLVQLLFGAM
jgi:hypothetical protein